MLPRPATMVTGVIVTFAIAGVMRLSTRGMSSPSAGGSPRQSIDPSSARLDSDRYQDEIEALESTLYQEAPPSMTDFMAISAALQDVSLAIADREVNPNAREVAGDVAMLAAGADVGESGFALPDIGEIRAEWESLRSRNFEHADWFREAASAPEGAEPDPALELDSSITADLLSAIDAIEALSETGRRACKELGEPFYEFEHPGAAGDEHIAKWNQFAREWEDDVSRVASRMPPPPAWNADVELTTAYQDVTSALRELRHATMGPGSWPVPFEGDWSARFDEATRLLEKSRSRLSPR